MKLAAFETQPLGGGIDLGGGRGPHLLSHIRLLTKPWTQERPMPKLEF